MSKASLDARFLLQAEGYLELELPVPALESLRRVSAKTRETFEWSFLCAEACRCMHRYEDALPLLDYCRKLRPEVIAVYINLGWCHKRVGQLPKAIDSLRAAHRQCLTQESGEDHALVMYNLSCYYALAGQKNDMLYWLELALAKQPAYRKLIADESDFDAFRDDVDFQRLVIAVAKDD